MTTNAELTRRIDAGGTPKLTADAMAERITQFVNLYVPAPLRMEAAREMLRYVCEIGLESAKEALNESQRNILREVAG